MYINTGIILTVIALLFMVFWFTPLRRKWFTLNKPVIEPLQKKVASELASVTMPVSGNKNTDIKIRKEKIRNAPLINEKTQNTNDGETKPILNPSELRKKDIHFLMKLAKEHNIQNANQMGLQDLIFALLQSQSKRNVVINVSGVLETVEDGSGFLRSQDYYYHPSPDDIYVSPAIIENFNLRTGDVVDGQIKAPTERERYYSLTLIEKVNHHAPEAARDKIHFDNLTSLKPDQIFRMERQDGDMTSRIIDLISPIGMGQRGMIQAPPNIETSAILQSIATSISLNHPDVELTMLLINQPPEIITEMQYSQKGNVISACFDKTATQQVYVIEMVLENAKRQVENGKHVVILLDSIIGLTKAYNSVNTPSGVLPSDLDSNAILKAKHFFGSARNTKEGGSLTIVSTIEINTGSYINDVTFEELKGLSNMQVVLNSELYNKKISPPIDINKSFTLNDDTLIPTNQLDRINTLEKLLAQMSSSDAMEFLLERLKKCKNNEEFLLSMTRSS